MNSWIAPVRRRSGAVQSIPAVCPCASRPSQRYTSGVAATLHFSLTGAIRPVAPGPGRRSYRQCKPAGGMPRPVARRWYRRTLRTTSLRYRLLQDVPGLLPGARRCITRSLMRRLSSLFRRFIERSVSVATGCLLPHQACRTLLGGSRQRHRRTPKDTSQHHCATAASPTF